MHTVKTIINYGYLRFNHEIFFTSSRHQADLLLVQAALSIFGKLGSIISARSSSTKACCDRRAIVGEFFDAIAHFGGVGSSVD